MQAYQEQFIRLATECEALQFGDFTLKSGRQSPYFFNAGVFYTGEASRLLASCYVKLLEESGLAFDVLFGPAYKGVPLAVASAMHYGVEHGRNVQWCFNRKEAKDHGEGGSWVGAPLQGQRVVILDDVMTAGTALKEAVSQIKAAGATLVGVAILLDREEAYDASSADARTTREVLQDELGVPILSVVALRDVVEYLKQNGRESTARQLEQLSS